MTNHILSNLTDRLSESARKQMIEHAEATFPYECCGFLYGKDGDERLIQLAQPVENSKEGDQRRRFEISAVDYMKGERYAREHDIELLGIYHSHPNHPAIPSEHDRIGAVPFFSYIILSVLGGNFDHLRSWRLNEQEQFEEEHVKTLKIEQ